MKMSNFERKCPPEYHHMISIRKKNPQAKNVYCHDNQSLIVISPCVQIIQLHVLLVNCGFQVLNLEKQSLISGQEYSTHILHTQVLFISSVFFYCKKEMEVQWLGDIWR